MITARDWDRVCAVVFDVDGTLYHAGRLRRRMLRELLVACVREPRRFRELETLQVFRSLREELAEEEAGGIGRLQYERPAARLGTSPEAVRRVVDPWILERPLPHLRELRTAGAARLFARLRASGRTVAVLSDYPAEAKLAALELSADLIVCATDPDVDRMKPHPRGLSRLLAELGLDAAQCLMIGDRHDRDGEAARRVGMEFLIRADRPRTEREFVDFEQMLASIGASDRLAPPA